MFRFTIRDLLLVTVTVAMICGWLEEFVQARVPSLQNSGTPNCK